jgi:hypothetical protein
MADLSDVYGQVAQLMQQVKDQSNPPGILPADDLFNAGIHIYPTDPRYKQPITRDVLTPQEQAQLDRYQATKNQGNQ